MRSRTLLATLIAGASIAGAADAPSLARLQMDGFLAAFNSGERARIEAFGREHMPPDFLRTAVIDHTLRMVSETGGFEVLDVTEAGPLALEGHVRERLTRKVQRITVVVDEAAPQRISQIWFRSADESTNDAAR